MINSFLKSVFVVSLIICVCKGDEEIVSKDLFNELPCLSFGGKCVHESDCPEIRRTQVTGLCPIQQQDNVECCYSDNKRNSKSANSCRRSGGECISKTSQCPEFLLHREATDCSEDENCCILTN
ncbi:carboxypeptidase inhibitor-like [Achroia grisella]|uniref:carboxypeptidase inhibitor-like n=1 Tax=Achroia grisella TaxID=688607 RepID=UPI0027D2DD8C|nr:carboxypeptidase inhibitor-like [Achroia grisella]